MIGYTKCMFLFYQFVSKYTDFEEKKEFSFFKLLTNKLFSILEASNLFEKSFKLIRHEISETRSAVRER